MSLKRTVGRIDARVYTHKKEPREAGRDASQGERPRKKPALPGTWCWTSNVQGGENVILCCLSPPACGVCDGSAGKVIQAVTSVFHKMRNSKYHRVSSHQDSTVSVVSMSIVLRGLGCDIKCVTKDGTAPDLTHQTSLLIWISY